MKYAVLTITEVTMIDFDGEIFVIICIKFCRQVASESFLRDEENWRKN